MWSRGDNPTQSRTGREITAFAVVGLLLSAFLIPGMAAASPDSVASADGELTATESEGEVISILINELACNDEEDFDNRIICQTAAEAIAAKYGYVTGVIVQSAVAGSWAGPAGWLAGAAMGA